MTPDGPGFLSHSRSKAVVPGGPQDHGFVGAPLCRLSSVASDPAVAPQHLLITAPQVCLWVPCALSPPSWRCLSAADGLRAIRCLRLRLCPGPSFPAVHPSLWCFPAHREEDGHGGVFPGGTGQRAGGSIHFASGCLEVHTVSPGPHELRQPGGVLGKVSPTSPREAGGAPEKALGASPDAGGGLRLPQGGFCL